MDETSRIVADLGVVRELRQFGGDGFKRCSQCATCSVVCELSAGDGDFPRTKMLWAQWGLSRRMASSLDPWLCYYCGKCSERCPRQAEPGETMMALRRWLTSRYDFTGLSRLFYRSWKAQVLAILLVALGTASGLLGYGFAHADLDLYDGPGAFLSASAMHHFDQSIASILITLLAISAVRMWWLTTGSQGLGVPILSYVKRLYVIPLHFFTQMRFQKCDRRGPWVVHLALMLSYITMFVLIVFFLHQVQAGPAIDWRVHGPGYAASFGLVITLALAIRGRLHKTEEHYRHSHHSDWVFLIMLVLVVVSGIAQHVLHRYASPTSANLAYVAHLALDAPLLVLVVPFGKWSHMLFRPLAAYFAALHADAMEARQAPVVEEPTATAAAAGQ